MAEFGLFPNKSLVDEERVDVTIAARQLSEHDTTVEAATDESANRNT
jgi:hypothetical protein